MTRATDFRLPRRTPAVLAVLMALAMCFAAPSVAAWSLDVVEDIPGFETSVTPNEEPGGRVLAAALAAAATQVPALSIALWWMRSQLAENRQNQAAFLATLERLTDRRR